MADNAVSAQESRRAALAGGLGTVFEQYDFLMFGTAAGLVFNKLFFPSVDPRVGVLLAFVTYGTGSIARPIGGMVIAHFGDRLGRRKMLILTLGVTGLATALIGILPGYAVLGIWAPILLTLLRVIQGFFLGGEQSGAFVLVSEFVPSARRGWYGGFVTAGSSGGQLLGIVAFAVASKAPEADFLTWAWRIPFLLSVVLVAVALYVRLKLSESPVFQAIEAHGAKAKAPVIEALRTSWRKILLAAGVNVGTSVMIYISITFALSYLNTSLGLSKTATLVASMIGAAGQLLATLLGAWLSDRVGRTQVMLVASIASALFVFPFFLMLNTRDLGLVIVAMLVAMGLQGALFGPMAAYYAELFETRIRYTGVGLSFGLGVLIGGGLAPSAASGLFALTNGAWLPVACLLVAGALVTVYSLARLAGHGRQSLSESTEPLPTPAPSTGSELA